MKYLKKIYLVILITLGLVWSCQTDSYVIEQEKNNMEVNESAIFKNGITHFEVNGKTEYDRKFISKCAEGAYLIYYDYSNNKIAIFTTQEEFNKQIDSNIVYQKVIEKGINTENSDSDFSNLSDRKAENIEIDISKSNIQVDMLQKGSLNSVAVNNYNLNAFSLENDSDDLVLHQIYKVGRTAYYNTDLKTNSNTDVYFGNGSRIVSSTSTGALKKSTQYTSLKTLFGYSNSNYWNTRIVNHSNKDKLLLTYDDKNFSGRNFTVIRINKGKSFLLAYILRYDVKSYKVVDL